jgi:hypothetical protein
LTTGGRGRGIVKFMISSRRSIVASVVAGLALVVGVALTVGAQGGASLDRPAPEISGGPWINGQALGPAALRGRVVFVEFWTYG